MSVIEALTAELAKLPGIGQKTAQRLTYHMLKQPRESAERLAQAIVAVATQVRPCHVCGNLTEGERCAICADPRRDDRVICVVEEASDVAAIERSGGYRGRYHVLGGRVSPLDGVGPDELNLQALVARVGNGAGVQEVIVATNPSMEGEVTATVVQQLLRVTGAKVTRIGRGLPMGGDLEYADTVTIAQAIAARRDMGDEA